MEKIVVEVLARLEQNKKRGIVMKNIGTKKIETDRLILRRLTKSDAKDAYNNWCSSDVVPKDISETEELFSNWEKEYEELNTYRWIVEIKDTKDVIGTIDVLSKKDIQYGTCEIGYCYGERFWGMGYATETLKAVIKFLFEECDADVVFAEYMSNNPASGKVMSKSGMTYEGIQRSRMIDKDGIRNDLGSYSITKEEYFNI